MEFSINAVTRRQLFQGAALMLGMLGGGRVAHAKSRYERDARQVVGNLVDHLLQVISASAENHRQEHRLMAAIESQTDLTLLARMTMGRHWRRASVRQREAFVETFGHYLLRSFAIRLKRYAGADLKAARNSFSITGARDVGKNDVIVQSRITPPSGTPLRVDWRLRSQSGRLVIIDLVVEGVSLLVTQRSEFGAVLERAGIDGLITELQRRVAESA